MSDNENTARSTLFRLPTAAPDGLTASVLLAFLATAGIYYVNIMSAIVAGLREGLGITEADAGIISSANVYGAALGAFIVVFVVKHWPWRLMAVSSLVLLIVIDLVSTELRTLESLVDFRFAHGFVGGWLVGTAFAVIARTKSPDRTFGMLLVVQFGLGGLGVMYLPGLVPKFGPDVLFYALATFSAVTLLMTPFLDDYPVVKQDQETAKSGEGVQFLQLFSSLIAIFLFQAGNMALGAYIIGLGKQAGLELDFISTTLGLAAWIGSAGALLVILMGMRFGRSFPLFVALAITLAGNWAFHYSAQQNVYFLANCVTAITWAFVMPYLLGMSSAFDKAGRTAALAGFFSKMGLATGPFLGAYLLDGISYGLLIDIATVVLAASAFAAMGPALDLDRRSKGI
jgi:predicted MFS family arabinose efflux permease